MTDTTQSMPEGSARARALVVVDGAEPRRHALPQDGDVVVGRGDDADLRVDSTSVSRRHAVVHVRDAHLTIEDLESHNGTKVGGVALAPGAAIELAVGDVVECGNVMIVISGHDAGELGSRSLVVSDDARWFQRDGGERVNLGRRGALRLMLLALVERRIEAPGTALDTSAMFAVGWPDENIGVESAQARVFTSVRRLRALGLGDLLVTRNDGYLLDETANVLRG